MLRHLYSCSKQIESEDGNTFIWIAEDGHNSVCPVFLRMHGQKDIHTPLLRLSPSFLQSSDMLYSICSLGFSNSFQPLIKGDGKQMLWYKIAYERDWKPRKSHIIALPSTIDSIQSRQHHLQRFHHIFRYNCFPPLFSAAPFQNPSFFIQRLSEQQNINFALRRSSMK